MTENHQVQVEWCVDVQERPEDKSLKNALALLRAGSKTKNGLSQFECKSAISELRRAGVSEKGVREE